MRNSLFWLIGFGTAVVSGWIADWWTKRKARRARYRLPGDNDAR